MRRSSRITVCVVALAAVFGAVPVFAGFSGTDLFIPSVGNRPGAASSNWNTMIWVYNPGATTANVTVYFLERSAPSATPPSAPLTVGPGATFRSGTIIDDLFHFQKWGALRFVSASPIVVTCRMYNLPAGGNDASTQGQEYAGVPASFAIGAGQSTELLGVYQNTPSESGMFRYSFGWVETTGNTANVRVTAYNPDGSIAGGPKDYSPTGSYESRYYPIDDLVPAINATNLRLKVEVTAGTGKVVAVGSGVANTSNDGTTFEMQFADSLLSGGLSTVSHDGTLTGDGTGGNPLGLANGAVSKAKLSAGGGSAGQVLGTDGSSLIWQSPGGGLTLPYSGSASSAALTDLFLIQNTGSGRAIHAKTSTDTAIWGESTTGLGVAGYTNTFIGVGGYVSGTAGGVGVGGYASGTTGANAGVWGQTESTTTLARGVVGWAHATSGQTFGVWGQSQSTDSISAGVYGLANNTGVAGLAVAASGSTTGVWGQADTTGSGAPYAKGTGTVGTRGVVGWTTKPTGNSTGVWGQTESASDFSRGVVGIADASTGATQGVYGETHGTVRGSYGVMGQGGIVGVEGETDHGYGLEGISWGLTPLTSPLSIGVAGFNLCSGCAANTAYAGYFAGAVNITGPLSKPAGSFKIDHPLDPEHKILYHSFVESPDMMNIYNGNVTTDGVGQATIIMPDYFSALNRDFRYQLTVIGQFAQAIIARKIENNAFTIKTDKPYVEVSWQVTGIRKDAYANAHRIQVEENKPEDEQGTYLHPEEAGQPLEKGVEWLHHPDLMRHFKELRDKIEQPK